MATNKQNQFKTFNDLSVKARKKLAFYVIKLEATLDILTYHFSKANEMLAEIEIGSNDNDIEIIKYGCELFENYLFCAESENNYLKDCFISGVPTLHFDTVNLEFGRPSINEQKMKKYLYGEYKTFGEQEFVRRVYDKDKYEFEFQYMFFEWFKATHNLKNHIEKIRNIYYTYLYNKLDFENFNKKADEKKVDKALQKLDDEFLIALEPLTYLQKEFNAMNEWRIGYENRVKDKLKELKELKAEKGTQNGK